MEARAGPGQHDVPGNHESINKKIITDPDFPRIWPHDRENHPRRVPLLRRHHLRDYLSGVEGQERAMVRLNGEEARPLANKYTFVELVNEMGYKVPRQALAGPGIDRDDITGEFSDPQVPLMCKPLNGKLGLGIIQIPAGDLPQFLDSIGDTPFVVQERIPISQEMRYFRGVDEVDEVIRRVYLEREILNLEGDGQKTNLQLLRRADMPWYSKVVQGVNSIKTLTDVLPEGQSVNVRQPLSTVGKSKEEVEWSEGKQDRVSNMDQFMKQFLGDLQTKLGVKLPYLCFDVGVVKPSLLDGEYNFERMKEAVVFFESQMPFLVLKYIAKSATLKTLFGITRSVLSPNMRGRKSDFYPPDTKEDDLGGDESI